MLIVGIMCTLSFLVWLFYMRCVRTHTLTRTFAHLMRKTPALHSLKMLYIRVHVKIEMESYCMALDAVVRVRVRACLYQMEIDRQTDRQTNKYLERLSERESERKFRTNEFIIRHFPMEIN